jgi:carbonic anhydrase/acetyltransferase-like protein (isoleucine patch superfamily)
MCVIIGAESLVTPNTIIAPRTLALGSPAKPIRSINEKDLQMIRNTLSDYQGLEEIYQPFFK